MWEFTLYWTLIFVVGVHLAAAGYACMIQYKNWKIIWVVPVVYTLIGGIEALIAGNVVGGLYVPVPEQLISMVIVVFDEGC